MTYGYRAVLLAASLMVHGWAQAQPRPDVEPTSRTVAASAVTDPAAISDWLRIMAGSFTVDGQVEVRMRATRQPEDPFAEEEESEESEEQSQPKPFADMLIERMRMESGYDDVIEATPAEGSSDCTGIGTGPGVQCIFHITWPDMVEFVTPSEVEPGGIFNLPGGISNLAPSMAMFGLEPAAAGLRHLLVDSAGLAEGASGQLVGDTATFRTPCANGVSIISGLRPPPYRAMDEPPPPPPPRTCTRTIRIAASPGGSVVNLRVDIELDGQKKTAYVLALRRAPQN